MTSRDKLRRLFFGHSSDAERNGSDDSACQVRQINVSALNVQIKRSFQNFSE